MKHFFMRSVVLVSMVLVTGWGGVVARAQLAVPEKEIALYPGVAPGSETWTWTERTTGSPNDPSVENVVHPVLMYYPAEKAKAVGTAVIVAPGGGFSSLKMSYEGVDVAKRFNEMGVGAFVLKYRLKYTPPRGRGAAAGGAAGATAAAVPVKDLSKEEVTALATADCQQAIRILRRDAADYGIEKGRLGVVGFSAGGSAACRAIMGAADGRPDFGALIYAGSLNGDAPPAGAPKLFLAVAADDQSVGFQGSLDMFGAWRKANVPVELHIFQTGAHGFRTKGGGADHYMDRVEEWMKVNGYLGK